MAKNGQITKILLINLSTKLVLPLSLLQTGWADTVLEIEDQAELFAGKTVKLYQDNERLNQLCRRTQDYIKKHYSLDGAWKVVEGDFR